ncbi:hypothetical protein OGAPHI_005654 [Ogataea philodendri]|uniref:histidinol-phosphate transaminase n=1 Tax=Ogataea philodendri TaxID=1378263 RepID=A0A9P8NZG0_9ASCO|nr:uncharacterized protein OGAPHI_005654 [Ogataea philodendri]KAH3662402.1 hypothetical protein OGAPHI_005654 [Ogataea philodendri]
MFDITKIARPNILTLEPYRCARDDFKEGVLLDANENTHGPSIPNITAEETALELNRYPDPHQQELKQQICDFRNSEASLESAIAKIPIVDGKPASLTTENLCLGVGSDESIDSLIRCMVAPGKEKMLICPPTYGMYNICAVVNDVEVVKVPLDLKTFQIQPDAIIEKLKADSSIKLVYVTSPGNPTAAQIKLDLVEDLLKKVENAEWNGLVIIDEAYVDFCKVGSSVSVLVNKYPNLVVLQTLSKAFGLAGIRLGICFSTPAVSLLLNSMKYPYNISNLTSDVALRATTKPALAQMRQRVNTILEQRAILLDRLTKLPGIGRNIGGLDSNFVLVEILNKEGVPDNEVANKVYLTLAEQRNVVVRFRGKELGCTGCVRITIGTKEENKTLLEEFEKLSFGCVVNRPQWLGNIGLGVLGTHHESNLAGWVGWNGAVTVLCNRENILTCLLQVLDDVEVQPDALCLSGDDTFLGESVVKKLEVWFLEQRLCRTFWVRGVGDDHVKTILVVVQELETVSDMDSDLWVGVRFGHLWEVFFGNGNDVLVNVTQNGFLDTLVLDDFSKDTTISSSNDQHLLRVWMGVQSKMGNHLLVGKLVSFGGLDDSVQNQDVTIVRGLEHQHILVLGLLGVQNLVHLERHGLAGPHGVANLGEPAVLDHWVRKLRHWKKFTKLHGHELLYIAPP